MKVTESDSLLCEFDVKNFIHYGSGNAQNYARKFTEGFIENFHLEQRDIK